jgi:ribosome biogenesis protein ENP2
MSGEDITSLPEVTALAFRDSLTFGVGNSAGYVSLFDLRSPSPVLTKDHMYGLPIKKIRFHEGLGQVMSLDAKGIKIWDSKSGEAFTSIESKSELNDFDIFPRSGLIVSANEQPRLQVHYLPSLGPAPRWCSFLDNITEELEESATADVYDNYKFLTRAQLEALELDHLIGTPLLRAYMHGYFIDVRLYRKAQALAGPVDSEYKSKYVEEKVRKEMAEKQRRVEAKKKNKPSVNAELFERLQEQEEEEEAGVQTAKKSKKAAAAPILKDERFKPMFENVDFTIDPDEDAYKLINPVLSKMKESKANKKAASTREMEEAAVEAEGISGSEEADSDSMADDDSDSSEEEEMPKRKKKSNAAETSLKEAKTYSLKDVSEMPTKSSKKDRMSLSSRLDRMGEEATAQTMKRHADGSHSMTFKKTASKKEMAAKIKNEKHMEERRKLRRSAGALKNRKALRN